IASGTTTGTMSDAFTTATTTTYYWRVNATDGIEWSTYGNDPPGYWTFITTAVTNNPPNASFLGVDGLLSGTDGIMHVLPDTPDLNWTYTDPESAAQVRYEVKVGTAPGLSDLWAPGIVTGNVQSVTYAGGAALVNGTDYHFSVRVSDGTKWSDWNETLFRMNAPPPIPTLDWPGNQDSDIMPGDIDLGWNSVTDPDGDGVTYYWHISEQSDFTPLEDSGTETSATATFTAQPETTYYWRVRAYDGYEFSANSTTFEFTTIVDTGIISGKVVDDSTGDPIEGAVVSLIDSNDDVIETDSTDLNGDFEFADLDFDTYSVRVTKSGYNEHIEENVIISSGDRTKDLPIRLTEKVAEEFDWTLIWILLIVIAIIIVVLLILLMKRRKRPEEAPPAERPIAAYPDQPPQQVPPPQEPQPEVPAEQPPPAEPQPVEPRPPETPAESE
ncbi:MAG: carboxypeptidase-like regulatory domain-containing protein, partial [Candidatus Thermoplasmatota archaeon]|nr:carboxypeptidase-like regulatory domain-containing protein [Candidatus Thermoplasmatota archaeon]